MADNEDLNKSFHPGKVIAGRWKVWEQIGVGGMGAVYKVEDKLRKNFFAAMKIEDNRTDIGLLKLEVHVLKQLQKMKYAVKLYDSGRRKNYRYAAPPPPSPLLPHIQSRVRELKSPRFGSSDEVAFDLFGLCGSFMVMSLFDKDLMTLKREYGGRPFSESTTLRLAISTLYAIKQLHEIGYIHRDIKSGNCMIGKYGRDRRMVYLIDYGMVRSFVVKDKNGKMAIRKPRDGEQLFRGTPRYCSLGTHYGKEQGRVDDLWCWLYMIIELHIGLPWSHLGDEKQILAIKENCPPNVLLKSCPKEFFKIHDYLKTLGYSDRPDYYGLYSECIAGLKRVKGSFLDPYEWEGPPEEFATALSISESCKTRKPLSRVKLANKTYPSMSVSFFKKNILKL
ncbi:hypothetical protein DICVIV_04581 [Dictyocaulus viviparus]|uniref:non-specific serine/threonine protein kinase n=1 Tax=Dictyocaulus viviparus TaxID=29172 RepID=A0A0D8XZT1_DICVI|nr:hypothetical protein DICVIV_04581 [Dictyocaulus viviparus]